VAVESPNWTIMSLANGIIRSALRGGGARCCVRPVAAAVRGGSCGASISMLHRAANDGRSSRDNEWCYCCPAKTARSFATGTRGSRGHGWYLNYRAGKGGRHLQGEYHDRESPEECAAWNDAVLQLGSTPVYLDVVAEPRRHASAIRSKKLIEVPPLNSLVGEKYRLVIDVASTVMPETTQNFMDLMAVDTDGYLGTRMYRIEKNVGLCGGDVLTNTGKTGKAARGLPLTIDVESDPLPLWHIPGTVTMLVPRVGEIDSRFILVTQPAPHIDGICRAFGRMTPETLSLVTNWQTNWLTRDGIPTAFDLIVVECGVLRDNAQEESSISSSSSGATEENLVAQSNFQLAPP
jgi:cyclophilin family peptidyl-prolyl cis-trans isomerase